MANKSLRKGFEKIVTAKGRRFLLRVEMSDDSRDYAKYENLREEVWGFPEDNLPGTRNLMCENFLHEGSALFIEVYAETAAGVLDADREHFIAFSYGFVGVKNKDIGFRRADNLRFYSQYTAVKEEYRRYGLSVLIKEFQRDLVLGLFGVSTITCTYDPLTGVNGWRNVHYFGMEVAEYRVSTYGEYGGLLNRLDIPSDRFFMSWDLRREAGSREFEPEALRAEENCPVRVEEKTVSGRSGPASLEVASGVDLRKIGEAEGFLFVRIPRDFYLMLRETDVEDGAVRRIPLDWRLQTRQVFQTLFQKKYRVVDFFRTPDESRKNFYVLQK
jgi:predicted GNAT superfamily acetyltransferase